VITTVMLFPIQGLVQKWLIRRLDRCDPSGHDDGLMAELNPVALPTLSTLVGATVFSTTFLINRVHRERGRAIDRALELQGEFAGARRKAEPVDVDWFDGQQEAIEETLDDQLALLALGMNAILAGAVVALVVAFGRDAGTQWLEPQGWGLIAFAASAVLIFLVGTVDVLRVQSDLRRRLSETAAGQCAIAEARVRRLAGREGGSRKEFAAARKAAADAVRASNGSYAPAWAMLGYVELASLAEPSEPDHLLRAGTAFDRAIKVGPETAPVWAARAVVFEEFGDFDSAAGAWIGALELYSKASETDVRPESIVSDGRTRERVTGRTLGGTYGWLFRPGHPETLAAALKRLPSLGAHTFFTAELLARAADRYPDRAELAATGLREWLDRLIAEPAGWRVAELQARQLARTTDAGAVNRMVGDYLSQDGPVARQQAEENDRERRMGEALAEATARQAELEAELKEKASRIIEDFERQREEQRAFIQEAQEKSDRIKRVRRGEATEEDLAWRERVIEEVIDKARATDTEQLVAEAQADARKARERHAEFEERARIWDEQREQMRADLERRLRLRAGRATREDLAWLQQQRLATAPPETPPS
jgi:hypothetical protein